MRIELLLFASLKDRAKSDRLTLELDDPATVADLKARLASTNPDLAASLPTALVSVNREFAFATDPLKDGDEVALFPPVSGGSVNSKIQTRNSKFPTTLSVTQGELDLNELVAGITLPTTGAACIFTGMVRGQTLREGLPPETEYLEYEAYVPMAEAKMRQVADEIRERWPAVEGIAIVQRIGRLAVGTPTVLIACSAGHRDTGVFEAARYGIDRLKEIVPVWKKEVTPAGEAWVEGHYRPGVEDRRGMTNGE